VQGSQVVRWTVDIDTLRPIKAKNGQPSENHGESLAQKSKLTSRPAQQSRVQLFNLYLQHYSIEFDAYDMSVYTYMDVIDRRYKELYRIDS
jgi:hypothetical protein